MQPQLLTFFVLAFSTTTYSTAVVDNCLNSDFISLQCKVHTLKEKITRPVGFTVGIKKDITYDRDYINDAMIFDDLRESVGVEYNQTSGYFTVPVHGVYSFHITAAKRSCKDCEIFIGITAPTYGHKISPATARLFELPSSVSAVVEMKAGEKAQAKVWGTTNKPVLASDATYFTGVLLSPL